MTYLVIFAIGAILVGSALYFSGHMSGFKAGLITVAAALAGAWDWILAMLPGDGG